MPKEKLTATHHAVVLTCISFLYTETINNCSSCLHPDLYNQNTKKMRNKQKHINVTVANQFTVHRTSYCKENFSFNKSEGEKHRIAVFSPPQHFTVIKKYGGPCCSAKKGQSSNNNFDNNAQQIFGKFEAFDFTEQTQRTVKDQNIWRQFLQSPQTLQWAHLGRAS